MFNLFNKLFFQLSDRLNDAQNIRFDATVDAAVWQHQFRSLCKCFIFSFAVINISFCTSVYCTHLYIDFLFPSYLDLLLLE
jgi:hypothetical protein